MSFIERIKKLYSAEKNSIEEKSESVSDIWTLNNYNEYLKAEAMGKLLKNEYQGTAAELVQEQIINPKSPGMRYPVVNYFKIFELARQSYPVQRVKEAIIREINKMGYFIAPKFEFKCELCGEEFQKEVEKCDRCGGSIAEPDLQQQKKFQNLIANPNQFRQTFKQMISSLATWDLITSDWYIEVSYEFEEVNGVPTGQKYPVGYQILDPRITFKTVDERGQEGSNEYFCPYCIQKALEANKKPATEYFTKGKRQMHCKYCGQLLEETYFVQEDCGNIISRWGKDEIIHGTRTRVLPKLYGEPLLFSLYEATSFVDHQDKENLARAFQGQDRKVIILPGQPKTVIKEIYEQLEYKSQHDIRNFRPFFIAIPGLEQAIQEIELARPATDSKVLEIYDRYLEAIATTFSVTLKWVGKETPGRLGHFDIDIEVQEAGITNITSQMAQTLNMMFKEIFGITDWVLKFGAFQKEDIEAKIDIEQKKANVIQTYATMGMEAEFDKNNNIKIVKKSEGLTLQAEGYKIGKIVTFPQVLVKEFEKLIIEGHEERLDPFEIQNNLEDAATRHYKRKLNVTEIENLKRIVRNELARIGNLNLFQRFEEREKEFEKLGIAKEDFPRYDWGGPDDAKTTELCREIVQTVKKIGKGKGVLLKALKKIVEDISLKYNYGTGDFELPHIHCRHFPKRKVIP